MVFFLIDDSPASNRHKSSKTFSFMTVKSKAAHRETSLLGPLTNCSKRLDLYLEGEGQSHYGSQKYRHQHRMPSPDNVPANAPLYYEPESLELLYFQEICVTEIFNFLREIQLFYNIYIGIACS